jgi:hypothetical protein
VIGWPSPRRRAKSSSLRSRVSVSRLWPGLPSSFAIAAGLRSSVRSTRSRPKHNSRKENRAATATSGRPTSSRLSRDKVWSRVANVFTRLVSATCRGLLELRHPARDGCSFLRGDHRGECPGDFLLGFGHDLRRPRLEVVKGLLQLCDTLVEPGRCPQGGGATRCSPKDRS